MANKKDTIKEISVKDFAAGFLKKDKADKKNYVDSVVKITRKYVPITEKIALARNLIDATSRVRDDDNSTDGKVSYVSGVFKINSAVRYVLTVQLLIECYTNLRFEQNDLSTDYDLLAKHLITVSDSDGSCDIRLLDYIIEHIPSEDIDEFMRFIDNTYSDMIANEYENHAFISNHMTRLVDVLGVVLAPISEKISQMDEKDFERITNLANKAAKFVK